MRILFALLLTGVALSGAIPGARAHASGATEPQERPEAVPGPGEDGSQWTPERLKAAEPIELPHPERSPDSLGADDPNAAAVPSRSGAGSPGGPEAVADENRVLIPGVAEPDGETTRN